MARGLDYSVLQGELNQCCRLDSVLEAREVMELGLRLSRINTSVENTCVSVHVCMYLVILCLPIFLSNNLNIQMILLSLPHSSTFLTVVLSVSRDMSAMILEDLIPAAPQSKW